MLLNEFGDGLAVVDEGRQTLQGRKLDALVGRAEEGGEGWNQAGGRQELAILFSLKQRKTKKSSKNDLTFLKSLKLNSSNRIKFADGRIWEF